MAQLVKMATDGKFVGNPQFLSDVANGLLSKYETAKTTIFAIKPSESDPAFEIYQIYTNTYVKIRKGMRATLGQILNAPPDKMERLLSEENRHIGVEITCFHIGPDADGFTAPSYETD